MMGLEEEDVGIMEGEEVVTIEVILMVGMSSTTEMVIEEDHLIVGVVMGIKGLTVTVVA